jgi:hypothetical protein
MQDPPISHVKFAIAQNGHIRWFAKMRIVSSWFQFLSKDQIRLVLAFWNPKNLYKRLSKTSVFWRLYLMKCHISQPEVIAPINVQSVRKVETGKLNNK